MEALLHIINQPTRLLSLEERRRLAEETLRLLEEHLPRFRAAAARLAEKGSQKQHWPNLAIHRLYYGFSA